jgi:hypothetical protein
MNQYFIAYEGRKAGSLAVFKAFASCPEIFSNPHIE